MASSTRILNAAENKISMVWARTTYMNTKVFINCISNATISQTMRKYNIKKNLSGKKSEL